MTPLVLPRSFAWTVPVLLLALAVPGTASGQPLAFARPAMAPEVRERLAQAGKVVSPRSGHSAIYDPVRNRMVVFGGVDTSLSYRNDVWTLTLTRTPAWTVLAPGGTPPSPRRYHSAIYDPVRDRMVVFGGYDGSYRDDVWALSFVGAPAWTNLTPGGTRPKARYGHTAIYDPVRARMVVFGGDDGSGPYYRNDVWALSLAGTPGWTELTPTGTPPRARHAHSAIYDPVRDRMVVFGGWDGSSDRNDVWALSLAGTPAWMALSPAGRRPRVREGHSAIYDPVRDRMVVFGGRGGGRRNDVWALALAGAPAWNALTPAGTPPSGRYSFGAIYRAPGERMVVFGGWDGSYRNDVWVLSLAGPPAWIPLK